MKRLFSRIEMVDGMKFSNLRILNLSSSPYFLSCLLIL